MQLNFKSIQENLPSEKWQSLFNTHWNAYRTWFQSKGAFQSTSLQDSKAAVKKYMPKFYDTYEQLCKLAGNSEEVQRFLSGYNPPAYISGCSQLAFQKNPMLIRNYDYHPHLSEGTLIMSAWNSKKVIATGDCLIGAVDGINEDGIAISLTFGGRKEVGKGFGIPFIIRYALEFSSTIDEAIEILRNIPSHMSYNVAVMDQKGNHKIIMLAPDKSPKILVGSVSTNHQEVIDWPEHAAFSKTVEREKLLQALLKKDDLTQEEVIKLFLNKPLFSNRYSEGFGTVYTAVYKPKELAMELRWKGKILKQSFENFVEQEVLIDFTESTYTAPVYERPDTVEMQDGENNWEQFATYSNDYFSTNSINILLDNMKYVPGFDSTELKKKLERISSKEKQRGEIPWEMIADFWLEFGKGF
jgi:predicted choloylglycine hydrolase